MEVWWLCMLTCLSESVWDWELSVVVSWRSLSLSPVPFTFRLRVRMTSPRPNITCYCRVSCGRSCKAADIMFNFKLPCDYESEVVIVDFSLSMVFAHLISASFKDALSSCRMFIASDNHLRQSCSGWAKNCKQRTPSYVCTYIYTCSLDQILMNFRGNNLFCWKCHFCTQ